MALSPYYGRYTNAPHNYDPFHHNSFHFDPFNDPFFHDTIPHHDFPLIRAPPFFPSMPLPPPELSSSRSKMEYKETPEAHHFTAEFPGLRKEDVQVHIEDGNVLHIRGQKCLERKDQQDRFHRYERSQGQFVTKFKLPANARPEHMRTRMDNGVLSVIVPKANPAGDSVRNGHRFY